MNGARAEVRANLPKFFKNQMDEKRIPAQGATVIVAFAVTVNGSDSVEVVWAAPKVPPSFNGLLTLPA